MEVKVIYCQPQLYIRGGTHTHTHRYACTDINRSHAVSLQSQRVRKIYVHDTCGCHKPLCFSVGGNWTLWLTCGCYKT